MLTKIDILLWICSVILICVNTIEVISTKNQYELRRPLRYQYYRLNVKADINPLISHLANQNRICSSKTGPFCSLGRQQKFMEIKLIFDEYSQNEYSYYQLEKYYLPHKRLLAERINAGKQNVFMIPSNQYKKIDQQVRFNIKSLMYNEDLILPSQKQRATLYKQKKQKQQQYKKQQQILIQRQRKQNKNKQNNKKK